MEIIHQGLRRSRGDHFIPRVFPVASRKNPIISGSFWGNRSPPRHIQTLPPPGRSLKLSSHPHPYSQPLFIHISKYLKSLSASLLSLNTHHNYLFLKIFDLSKSSSLFPKTRSFSLHSTFFPRGLLLSLLAYIRPGTKAYCCSLFSDCQSFIFPILTFTALCSHYLSVLVAHNSNPHIKTVFISSTYSIKTCFTVISGSTFFLALCPCGSIFPLPPRSSLSSAAIFLSVHFTSISWAPNGHQPLLQALKARSWKRRSPYSQRVHRGP